jgi:hypothetical protein
MFLTLRSQAVLKVIVLLYIDIGTGGVDLPSLDGVPSEGGESIVRDVVGNLNLLGNGVPTGSRSVARVQSSVVNALALRVGVCTETVASEPVITPEDFSFHTICTLAAGLSRKRRCD